MSRVLLLSLLTFSITAIYGQGDTNETLGKKIDDLTYSWDLESDNLDDYDGMLKFCTDKDYRNEIVVLLSDIHHYDSVLLERLQKASRFGKDKDVEKVLKDLSKFEEEYSMKEFIGFLYDECKGIQELEKNRSDLEDEITIESYDGKRYILETELAKFIHHVTKKVDIIREHVHHLHIK